jgi:cytochrome c
MDSFELNKIAGAVLAALLLIFGSGTLIEILQGGSKSKAGYTLPLPKAAMASVGGAPADAGVTLPKIAELMTKASVEGGAAAFKKCASCHSVDKGGKNGTGPNLWNIVGRKIGGVEGFNYSNANKAKGGEWNWEALVPYIYAPAAWMPGNKMAFAGVKEANELADVMVYLRSLSDSPVALPK